VFALRRCLAFEYKPSSRLQTISICSGGCELIKRVLTSAIALVLLLACVGTVSAETNLILNAGFETPEVQDACGWDWYTDGTLGMDWHVEKGIGAQADIDPVVEIQTGSATSAGHAPYEGKQFTELDSHANVKLSQSFKTEKGATYRITYAQSCRYNDPHLPSTLGVFLNDKEILTTSEGMDTTNGCKDWQVHTVDFTGDGEAVTLTFAGEGVSDQYGPLLDGVEVTDPVIPSPEFPSASLPIGFIIGFVGVIFLIQRIRE
jgi:hypothetical protein